MKLSRWQAFRARAQASGFAGMTHGTPATYSAGCKCVPCKAANTARCREYRDRKARQGFAGLTHGRPGTYSAGCRCGSCRYAGARAHKASNLRRRERERGQRGG